MSILILTGPPASSKNSVSSFVARRRERCAVIDVDQVRWMLVQPHVAPWEGEEGKHQSRLGVENACYLAARFAEDGCDVLLLDFLWNDTVAIYREQLAGYRPQIVLLMPTLKETLRRNHTRGWLPAHEVEMLYEVMENCTDFDAKIDKSAMSIEFLAQILSDFIDNR
jgi:hypothetical protein